MYWQYISGKVFLNLLVCQIQKYKHSGEKIRHGTHLVEVKWRLMYSLVTYNFEDILVRANHKKTRHFAWIQNCCNKLKILFHIFDDTIPLHQLKSRFEFLLISVPPFTWWYCLIQPIISLSLVTFNKQRLWKRP